MITCSERLRHLGLLSYCMVVVLYVLGVGAGNWIKLSPTGTAGLWIRCGLPLQNSSMNNNTFITVATTVENSSRTDVRYYAHDNDSEENDGERCDRIGIISVPGYLQITRALMLVGAVVYICGLYSLKHHIMGYMNNESNSRKTRFGELSPIIGAIPALGGLWVYGVHVKDDPVYRELMPSFDWSYDFVEFVIKMSPFIFLLLAAPSIMKKWKSRESLTDFFFNCQENPLACFCRQKDQPTTARLHGMYRPSISNDHDNRIIVRRTLLGHQVSSTDLDNAGIEALPYPSMEDGHRMFTAHMYLEPAPAYEDLPPRSVLPTDSQTPPPPSYDDVMANACQFSPGTSSESVPPHPTLQLPTPPYSAEPSSVLPSLQYTPPVRSPHSLSGHSPPM